MPHANKTRSKGVTADVDGVAFWALSKIAEDLGVTSTSTCKITEHFVDELYKAAASIEREPLQRVVQQILDAGISEYELADIFIPRVAALLGEAWCQDNINFAETTIGSARLQGVLRSLGPEWCAEDIYIGSAAPRCLVVVPEGAQHTLGATILTGQLRRAGLSVSLDLNAGPSNVFDRLSTTTFDVVLISASARESLASISRIVQKVRQTGQEIPVIVGGNVLSLDQDIAQITGADIATSDLQEAIGFCGFNVRMLRVVSAP